jgi:hypothetical protein
MKITSLKKLEAIIKKSDLSHGIEFDDLDLDLTISYLETLIRNKESQKTHLIEIIEDHHFIDCKLLEKKKKTKK